MDDEAFRREVFALGRLFDRQTFLRSADLVSAMIGEHAIARGMEMHRAGYPDAEVARYVAALGDYYREQYATLLAAEQEGE